MKASDMLKQSLGLTADTPVSSATPTYPGAGEPSPAMGDVGGGGAEGTGDVGDQRMGTGNNANLPHWYDQITQAMDQVKVDLQGSINPQKILASFVKTVRDIAKNAAEGEKAARGEPTAPEDNKSPADKMSMAGMGSPNNFMDRML